MGAVRVLYISGKLPRGLADVRRKDGCGPRAHEEQEAGESRTPLIMGDKGQCWNRS